MSVIGSNVLAGASGGAGAGYAIERSLRFNSGDSAYLNRTPSSAGNRKTWTWSGWVKRSKISITQTLFSAAVDVDNRSHIFLFSDDTILIYGQNSGSQVIALQTNSVHRDPSSWFHLIVSVDTTQSTTADRCKIYINGAQLVENVLSSYPSQNTDLQVNDTCGTYIGTRGYTAADYADCYLAEVNFIDGQALDPTSFGAFDSNGVWQVKKYSGTYGTNGFHLDFKDNSSNAALGTDTSGNSNTWTVNNLIAAGESISTDAIVNVASNTVTGSWNLTGTNFPTDSSSTICGSNSGSTETITKTYAAPLASTGAFRVKTSCGSAKTIQVAFNGQTAVNYACTSGFGVWNSSISCPTSITSISLIYPGLGTPGFDLQNLSLDGTTNELIANDITLTTASNNNYSSLAVGDSNNAGVSITAINSSTPSIAVDGGSWSNGDVFSTATNVNADNLRDSPTNGTQTDTGAGGEVVGNYATLNPLSSQGGTLSDGNLAYTGTNNNFATIAVTSGKWYWEVTNTGTLDNVNNTFLVGVTNNTQDTSSFTDKIQFYAQGSQSAIYRNSGSAIETFSGTTLANGDVLGIALDLDSGTQAVQFYKNGSTIGSSTSLNNANQTWTPSVKNAPASLVINFGQRAFAHAAPSGYKCLNTANLPEPTIADGSQYFDTKLYTGNGGTQSISSLAFQPDFVWLKGRSQTNVSHQLYDSVRGTSKMLQSDNNTVESTVSGVSAFNSNGFTLGSNGGSNNSGSTYVSWAWDAGSSTVSNTDGSITSQVRANQSAGFSIVKYTYSSTATVGHGLNAQPHLIIQRPINSSGDWYVYTKALGYNKAVYLNLTNAVGNTSTMNSVDPTSTVFTTNNWNPGDNLAYCFAPVEGYSAMGSYTGNGSADGPFIYTGFRPAWVVLKMTSGTSHWTILDTTRSAYNVTNEPLYANLANAEDTNAADQAIDILSNGFKLRSSAGQVNQNNGTYVYLAFASNPFASNGGLAR